MTENEHTPGPWVKNGARIFTDWPSFDCVCTVQASNVPEWEDNARLIAAAPELLEALKDLHWAVTGFGDFESAYPVEYRAALNAIAKATGSDQ